jgi:anti-sigma regulatory factor (Ser/Thr protein kinase)
VFSRRSQRFGADLGNLREARRFADRAAEDFGLDRDSAYRVRLALSEAVANAIKHGSESPDDPVEIVAADEAGALVFYVRDGGRFVPRVAPRGELPERGRGLEFMRRLMDEVDLRPGSEGTEVRFSLRPS